MRDAERRSQGWLSLRRRPIVAISVDYDDTIAEHGVVDEATTLALCRWVATGGYLILNTGRRLDLFNGKDGTPLYPFTELFDAAVLGNGSVVTMPSTRAVVKSTRALTQAELTVLRSAGTQVRTQTREFIEFPLSDCHAIQKAVRDGRLDVTLTRTPSSVAITARGVDKASGLRSVLRRVHVMPSRVAHIGDGTNDMPAFGYAGIAVAVANAQPEAAGYVWNRDGVITTSARGAGVAEFIDTSLARNRVHQPALRTRSLGSLGLIRTRRPQPASAAEPATL
jgi:hydroxymethylpyrimidine pyrophosphatase-like HAD family hydrolase